MPRKPRSIPKTKDKASQVLTIWGAEGVRVVGVWEGRPLSHCSFGGESPSFRGDEALSRTMLEAAIEAVRNGALGGLPFDRRVYLLRSCRPA